MPLLLRAFVPLLLLALAACAPGKPTRVFPPTASIQELAVREDGSWDLTVRVQSFSNVGTRIQRIEAKLEIGGAAAATIDQQPDVVVPAGSAEILRIRISPDLRARQAVAELASRRDSISYRLTGTIHSTEPNRRRDPFEFASALTPVPGLPGILR